MARGHGSAHPHVVERRLVGAEVDHRLADDGRQGETHLRVRLLERAALLDGRPRPHVAELHLAGAKERQARRGVGGDLDDHAVEIGQRLHEVIGVFLEDATIVAGPHHESHNDQ